MKFSCEKCGRSYVADEMVRGRAFKMKCKQCGNLIVVKASPALEPLGGAGPVPLPPAGAALRQPNPQPLPSPAADPFAFDAPPAADPFPLPPDPFAAAPPDPFAHVSYEPAPGLESAVAPDPRAGAPTLARAVAFDPFGELGEASPPAIAAPAPSLGGETVGGSRLSDVEALFADLAEEMKEDAGAEEPLPAARPQAQVEPAPPMPGPSPPDRVPAAGAPSIEASPSRRGVALAASAALVAAAAGVGWFLTRSAGPTPAAAGDVAVVVASRASAAEPASARALTQGEDLPAAAPSKPERRREAPAQRTKAIATAPKPAPKPTIAAAPRPTIAAAPPPAHAAQPQPAPEPPAGEVSVAQVEVRRRSAAPQAAPPAALHTSPAAPPLTSDSDLPPLDDKMIEATVAKYESSFDACVAAARQGEPGLALAGRRVVVTMTVNPNGHALYPTVDDVALGATDLGSCLKRESGKMVFPAFGGEPIRARVPLTLH